MRTHFNVTAASIVCWAAFAGWLAGLWWVSSLPGTVFQSGPDIPYFDKVIHIGFFFVGGLILSASVVNTFGWTGWRPALAVIATMAVIGVVDELHQTFTPNRQGGDPGDWMADIAGGVAAAFIYGRFIGWQNSAKSGATGC